SQESEKARKMTVTSGRRCSELLTKSDPVGLLVKTLLASSVWYNPRLTKLTWKAKPIYKGKSTVKLYKSTNNMLSRQFVRILNTSDTPSNRLLFQLVPSVRRTEEIGYGLLPTPRAMEVIEHPMKQATRLGDRTGMKLNNLQSAAKFGLLPTPTTQEPTTLPMDLTTHG